MYFVPFLLFENPQILHEHIFMIFAQIFTWGRIVNPIFKSIIIKCDINH
jgi:hypothetical protein